MITKNKQKKAMKVKRKVVKCVKKKTTKKKAVKKALKKTVKKVVKKSKKKTVKRKKRKKRTRKKKVFMQDIYAIINKIQLKKKKVVFATDLEEAPVIENNIKDVGLDYNKVEMKTQVVFTIYPNNDTYDDDMLPLEIMDDEIPDIGQIFG
jgi:hypothetical protein